MTCDLKERSSVLCLLVLCTFSASAQSFSEVNKPGPLPPGSTLVIGFLGGYDRWNDVFRSVRQLVLRLRGRPGVYAESISNHHRAIALKLIGEALDTIRDGQLDPKEKANARVVLFGQSWGGAAAIATARKLQAAGIPVLLTVQ